MGAADSKFREEFKGVTYDGSIEWKEDGRYGKGIVLYSNGDKYVGEWLNELKHGMGIMNWKDGRCYDGEWRTGKRNGNGVYTDTNGEKYTGNWLDDKMHGQGTLQTATEIITGTWVNGVLENATNKKNT